jgi:hypothetical protein
MSIYTKIITASIIAVSALSFLNPISSSAMSIENCRPKCNINITVCKTAYTFWESCEDYSELKLCTQSDDTGCTAKKVKRDKFFLKYITTSPAGDNYLNSNSKYWSECGEFCKPF